MNESVDLQTLLALIGGLYVENNLLRKKLQEIAPKPVHHKEAK